MRTRFCTATLLAAAALAIAWGVMPVAGQTAAYRAPRTADGKPNLNGIWQALNEANWDIEGHSAGPGRVVALGAEDAVVPGLGIVEGGPLPYLPAAAAKKKENFDKRLTLDPEIKCYLPGVPRAIYMPHRFRSSRAQKTHHDGVSVRRRGAHDLHGRSQGGARRQLDGLVERTLGRRDAGRRHDRFNDLSWFDRAGNFHSDALHVVERFTRREPRSPELRSHDRGQERVLAAVEDEHAALPAEGKRRAVWSSGASSSSRI